MYWYENPIYSTYWNNYETLMKWHEKEIVKTQPRDQSSNANSNSDGANAIDSVLDFHTEEETEISEEYLQFLRVTEEHKHKREQAKIGKRINWEPSEYVNSENEEDFSGQIHTEFPSSADDYIPIDKLSFAAASGTLLSSSSSDLKNSKADSRRSTAAAMYGEDDQNLSRIFSLETALLLDFDNFIDEKKPRVWPVCPINNSALGLN